MPQARPKGSRPSASRDSIAGLTCSGWIRSKRGRSAKSSRGLVVVMVVGAMKKGGLGRPWEMGERELFYKFAVGMPRGVNENRHEDDQAEEQAGKTEQG